MTKPLQIFLLIAFVIAGASFALPEWLKLSAPVAPSTSKLRRLVEAQCAFLDHTQNGRTALAKRRINEAVSEFRLALQSENWAEGHENLGRALLLRGEPEAAFDQFKDGTKIEPGRMSLYAAWGGALVSQHHLEKAQEVFVEALKRSPTNGEIHYQLAKALQTMQQNALRRSRIVTANDPDGAGAHEREATNFAAQALEHYRAASRNGIETADFYCGYGELLASVGKLSDAVVQLELVVSKDPASVHAWAQLALVHERLGQYAGAIEAYEKVLSLLPDDATTLNSLALIYATASQPEARSSKMAILLATRACDATSNQNALFMDTLARAYAADGDFSAALTWEDKAILRLSQILSDNDLLRQLLARRARFADHKAD